MEKRTCKNSNKLIGVYFHFEVSKIPKQKPTEIADNQVLKSKSLNLR